MKKQILLAALGALALAGSVKADVVEYHGYFISDLDTGEVNKSQVHQASVAPEGQTIVQPVPAPVRQLNFTPQARALQATAFFLIGTLIFALAVLFYFIPAIVARGKRNAGAIFVLNLLAGWSFIGWVIAIVWACTAERQDGALV